MSNFQTLRSKTGRYVRFSDISGLLSIWNPETIVSGFRRVTVYSKRPKSEHVRISDRSPLFRSKSVQTRVTSEIRTNLFGFQTFGWMPIHVRTFGFRRYWHSYDMNAEIRTKLSFGFQRFGFWTFGLVRTLDRSDFGIYWKPNVRFSDVDCSEN